MKRINGCRLLLVLLFCLLIVPLLNTLTLRWDTPPLAGVKNDYEFPQWSWKSYWDGSFQQAFDDSFSHGFSGVRTLTRLVNELRFRAFGETNRDTIVCKDGSIIHVQYVNEYLGLDALHLCTPEYIDVLTQHLVRLRDLAQAQGKAFAVVVTPSKADFWAERIPDKYYRMERVYTPEQRGVTLLIAAMEEAGLPYVDGPAMLTAQDYPFDVFPETGIHFTREAAITELEGLNALLAEQGVTLKRIVSTGRTATSQPNHSFFNWDDDIWRMMNIVSRRRTSYTYPIEEEIVPEDCDTPVLFWQGGSFIYSLNDVLANHDAVSDFNILFYDIGLRDKNMDFHEIESLEDPLIAEAVEKSDVILLEVNAEYVYNMGCGFLPVLERILSGETGRAA